MTSAVREGKQAHPLTVEQVLSQHVHNDWTFHKCHQDIKSSDAGGHRTLQGATMHSQFPSIDEEKSPQEVSEEVTGQGVALTLGLV